MTIQAGEFWLADILYTNSSGSKIRPVLVLWLDGLDAVVAVVTSAGPRSATDVAVADWQAANLKLASTVRLSRLDCLEQSLFLRRIGALSVLDAQRLRDVWDLQVKPQF